MRRGGVAAKVYKPLNAGKYYDEHNRRIFPAKGFDWTAHYQEMVGRIEKLESAPDSRLMIARGFSDFVKARRAQKAAVILGNEGSFLLGATLKLSILSISADYGRLLFTGPQAGKPGMCCERTVL